MPAGDSAKECVLGADHVSRCFWLAFIEAATATRKVSACKAVSQEGRHTCGRKSEMNEMKSDFWRGFLRCATSPEVSQHLLQLL